MRAYRFVFENKKWALNLLLGVVCFFIPVIGPIVFWGYLCRVIDSLLRDEKQPYPDFDFARFVEYLKRGIWPFLVVFVLSLVAVPVFWACFAGVIIGVALLQTSVLAGVFLIAAAVLLCFVIPILMAILMEPMFIRAVLTRDFGSAFSWTFIKDFLRLNFWEVVLTWLFITFSGMLVVLVGTCICFVGAYPAAALVTFAQFHIHYQLYKLYLERGGTPIPLKEDSEG